MLLSNLSLVLVSAVAYFAFYFMGTFLFLFYVLYVLYLVNKSVQLLTDHFQNYLNGLLIWDLLFTLKQARGNCSIFDQFTIFI